MRVGLIITLFVCVLSACDMKDTNLLNEYDRAVSFYTTDIEKCEKLSLENLHNAYKAKNNEGVGKFAYLLAVINVRKEKLSKSAEYYMMSHFYYTKARNNKSAIKSLIELCWVNNQLGNHKFVKQDVKEILSSEIEEEKYIIKVNDYLAEAHIQLGEKDSALRIINRLSQFNPNDQSLKGLIYGTAGYLYLIMEDYEHSEEYLNKAIAIESSNEKLAYSYNNLACVYLKKGYLDKAMIAVNKSIGFNVPFNSGNAYRTRASIHIERKNYKGAEADFEVSQKYHPNHKVLAEGYEKIAKNYGKDGSVLQSKYWKLTTECLKERIRLIEEQNYEAKEVRESMFTYKKQQFLAQLTKKDQESIVIGAMAVAIILLIGYIFYDKMNKQKKDTIENIDSILTRIRKERRK